MDRNHYNNALACFIKQYFGESNSNIAPTLAFFLKKLILPLHFSHSPQSHLPPAAVSQALHDRVDLRLKHLGQLGTKLINTGRLAVVEPGVVEHQPDVVYVLPGLLVLACVELALYGGQVNWVLHNVKVVLEWENQDERYRSPVLCAFTTFCLNSKQ